MNTRLIIPVHSFVDLITNSSSELFVCDTKQSLKAFKATIVKLVKLYNQRMELREDGGCPIDASKLFTAYFNEPRVTPYTYDPGKYPKWDDYMSIHEWDESRHHPVFMAADRKIKEWEVLNPRPKHAYAEGKKKKSPEVIVYDNYYKEHDEKNEVFFTEWNKLQRESAMDFYRWIFKQNGLNYDDGKPSKYEWENRCGELTFKDDAVTQFMRDISVVSGYRFAFTKGNIILETASDSSVPYGLFEDIETVFTAHRHQCG